MDYLLLLLATFASATKALVCKRVGSDGSSERRVLLLNSMIFIFAAAVAALASPLVGGLRLSATTVIIAVVFAFSLLFTQLMQMLAMRHGPASVTTLIYSFGFLVPIAYGYVFLDESVSVAQLIGICVIALSLFFIVDPKMDRRAGRLWLILSFLAALGSGLNAVIQKLHRASAPENEISALLVLSFTVASVVSFIISRLLPRSETADRPIKRELAFTLFSGFGIGALNVLNLLIAGRLPAVIQFPIYNVGAMILVGIGGRLIFGDRITRRQLIGFAIGSAAILIIGLL